ncbi:hypothetical protein Taro_056971, partial [Colocasia esculenta]|nr:hypothetical protein [Colocasia esculenta]
EESFPLWRSGGSGLVERRRFVRSGGASLWERGGGGKLIMKAPLWVVVWGTLGCGILVVGLPDGVATAECVVTPEEASPQAGFPFGPSGEECGRLARSSPSHSLVVRWFRSHVWRSSVGPQLSRAAVVCGCVLGCDSLDSLYRGGCRQESAVGELEEWTICPSLHGGCSLAVFSSVGLAPNYCFGNPFLGAVVVAPLLLHVFDSAGSAGVAFGLTRVVVEAFLCFRYFVVLCSRCFSLYYFIE